MKQKRKICGLPADSLIAGVPDEQSAGGGSLCQQMLSTHCAFWQGSRSAPCVCVCVCVLHWAAAPVCVCVCV